MLKEDEFYGIIKRKEAVGIQITGIRGYSSVVDHLTADYWGKRLQI